MQEVLYSYIRQYETPDAPMTFDVPALRQALDLLRNQALRQAAGFHAQQIIGTNIADEDILPALLHPMPAAASLFAPPRQAFSNIRTCRPSPLTKAASPPFPPTCMCM